MNSWNPVAKCVQLWRKESKEPDWMEPEFSTYIWFRSLMIATSVTPPTHRDWTKFGNSSVVNRFIHSANWEPQVLKKRKIGRTAKTTLLCVSFSYHSPQTVRVGRFCRISPTVSFRQLPFSKRLWLTAAPLFVDLLIAAEVCYITAKLNNSRSKFNDQFSCPWGVLEWLCNEFEVCGCTVDRKKWDHDISKFSTPNLVLFGPILCHALCCACPYARCPSCRVFMQSVSYPMSYLVFSRVLSCALSCCTALACTVLSCSMPYLVQCPCVLSCAVWCPAVLCLVSCSLSCLVLSCCVVSCVLSCVSSCARACVLTVFYRYPIRPGYLFLFVLLCRSLLCEAAVYCSVLPCHLPCLSVSYLSVKSSPGWWLRGFPYLIGRVRAGLTSSPFLSTVLSVLFCSAQPLVLPCSFQVHDTQSCRTRCFVFSVVTDFIPPIPSFEQGFGRITLENVMKFADSTFNLFVINGQTLDVDGFQHYCFSTSLNDTQFKATLGTYRLKHRAKWSKLWR
jgi:hypothetical protein